MVRDNDPEVFEISIVGNGVNIKRNLAADKVALVMRIIMGGDFADIKISDSMVSSVNISNTRVSLREFLDSTKATTKIDQIVSIGHYMLLHEGKDTFSREDIKSRFQVARERPPSNFPRDFGNAIGKGMIAEDNTSADRFYVTKTGAKAVERSFDPQIR